MSDRPGDVVLVDLGTIRGHEQAGIRPAIFLHAEGNVSLLIPLSGNAKRLRFGSTVLIEPDDKNGLSRISVALVFQMRAVDRNRIIETIGSLSAKDKRAVNKIIRSITRL